MGTITVTLKSKDDYINRFNNERISPELSSYIWDECKTIKPKDKIQINVNSEFNISDEEKESFKNMLKLSYYDDIVELKEAKEKLIVMDMLLFLGGIIILILYYLNTKIIIMSEVILIIGWVLIWESIYNFIFARVENKMRIIKNKQIMNSNINFVK